MIPKAERKRCACPADLNRLIQAPLVAGPRGLASQGVGISLAEFETPFPDSLIS
jgi:hypothetical protein